MKAIFAAAVLISVAAFTPTGASAQGISVGPGGVRVDSGLEPRYRERRFERRRFERRGERCRVEVERRRNRFGELVTRRTRICR
jgi:hypothetical protein